MDNNYMICFVVLGLFQNIFFLSRRIVVKGHGREILNCVTESNRMLYGSLN